MESIRTCPSCGGPVRRLVYPDRTDPDVEWVKYLCPNCSPTEKV